MLVASMTPKIPPPLPRPWANAPRPLPPLPPPRPPRGLKASTGGGDIGGRDDDCLTAIAVGWGTATLGVDGAVLLAPNADEVKAEGMLAVAACEATAPKGLTVAPSVELL